MKKYLYSLLITCGLLLSSHAFAAGSFIESDILDTAASAYTFSGVSFGSVAADRAILIGFYEQGTGHVTDVTIDGVTATQVITYNPSAGIGVSFYIADVPADATGDVVVTLNSSSSRAGLGVWRLDNLLSDTADDTCQDYVSGASPALTCTLTPVSGNNFAVGIFGTDVDGAGTTLWGGATEDYFDQITDATPYFAYDGGGSVSNFAGGNLTMTFTTGSQAIAMAGVVFDFNSAVTPPSSSGLPAGSFTSVCTATTTSDGLVTSCYNPLDVYWIYAIDAAFFLVALIIATKIWHMIIY